MLPELCRARRGSKAKALEAERRDTYFLRMYKAEDLFDLKQTEHAIIFEGCEWAWDALKKIKSYIAITLRPGLHHTAEGESYIGPNVFIGEGTVVEHGAMIKGPDRIGVSLGKHSGSLPIWKEWARLGERMPVALVIGAPPLVSYAVVTKLEAGDDELALAGALAGDPAGADAGGGRRMRHAEDRVSPPEVDPEPAGPGACARGGPR